MRTSLNTSELFVANRPDLALGMRVHAAHETSLSVTRGGVEQRFQARENGKYRITFQRRGLSAAEWKARFVRIRAEIQSVCVVPFWIFGIDATRSAFSQRLEHGDGITKAAPGRGICVGRNGWLVESVDETIWKPEIWAFVDFGAPGYRFQRVMTAANEKAQTITAIRPEHGAIKASEVSRLVARHAANRIVLYPPIDDLIPEQLTARLYPALRCRRIVDNADERGASLESWNEVLTFETL